MTSRKEKTPKRVTVCAAGLCIWCFTFPGCQDADVENRAGTTQEQLDSSMPTQAEDAYALQSATTNDSGTQGPEDPHPGVQENGASPQTSQATSSPATSRATNPSSRDGSAKVADPLRQKYSIAAFEVNSGRTDTAHFRSRMEDLLDSFQEARVTTGEQELLWNVAAVNAQGVGFGAVRFRSPLDSPADLYWIVSANPYFNHWYIYPMRGAMQGFSGYERDLSLPEVELPNPQFVVAQKLNGGRIRPGVDYIIWFLSEHNQPVEIKYAIRLVPQGEREFEPGDGGILRSLRPLGDGRISETAPDNTSSAGRTPPGID